jgi:PleD family two-component response regulator
MSGVASESAKGASIEQLRPYLHLAHVASLIRVSASVAQWDMREPIESLMLRTDVALYETKQAGRDRIVLADAEGRTPADMSPERLDIE